MSDMASSGLTRRLASWLINLRKRLATSSQYSSSLDEMSNLDKLDLTWFVNTSVRLWYLLIYHLLLPSIITRAALPSPRSPFLYPLRQIHYVPSTLGHLIVRFGIAILSLVTMKSLHGIVRRWIHTRNDMRRSRPQIFNHGNIYICLDESSDILNGTAMATCS